MVLWFYQIQSSFCALSVSAGFVLHQVSFNALPLTVCPSLINGAKASVSSLRRGSLHRQSLLPAADHRALHHPSGSPGSLLWLLGLGPGCGSPSSGGSFPRPPHPDSFSEGSNFTSNTGRGRGRAGFLEAIHPNFGPADYLRRCECPVVFWPTRRCNSSFWLYIYYMCVYMWLLMTIYTYM